MWSFFCGIFAVTTFFAVDYTALHAIVDSNCRDIVRDVLSAQNISIPPRWSSPVKTVSMKLPTRPSQ